MSKRYLVIADIHANYQALQKLTDLDVINDEDLTIVFIGDYLDGLTLSENATIKTLEFVKDLQENRENVYVLLGNHDTPIVKIFKNEKLNKRFYNQIFNWIFHIGGLSTLNNIDNKFKENNLNLLSDPNYKNLQTIYQYIRSNVIKPNYEIFEWLSKQPLYLKFDNLIFSHAGLKLNKYLKNQTEMDLTWTREEFFSPKLYNINPLPYYKDKTIILGHTPVQTLSFGNASGEPINLINPNTWLIDGGSNSKKELDTTHINASLFTQQGQLIENFKLSSKEQK